QEPEPVTSTRLHVDVRRSVALHSRALHPELPPRCYRPLTMPARSLDKSSLSRGSYRTPMLVRLAQVGGTSSVRVDEDNASRRSSQFSFLSGIWSWPLGLSGICSCVTARKEPYFSRSRFLPSRVRRWAEPPVPTTAFCCTLNFNLPTAGLRTKDANGKNSA